MNQEKLNNIILLSEYSQTRKKKFKKALDKCVALQCKIMDIDDEKMCDKAHIMLLSTRWLFAALNGLRHEISEVKKVERATVKCLSIPQENVTGDLDTFVGSDKKYSVFADDFQYTAMIPKECLENLQVVVGDFDIRKLHDFQSLGAMKLVMGDVRASTATNIDCFSNLEVVTGDLHFEKLDKIPSLQNLSYLGGHLYTDKSILSFEDIKSSTKQKSKVKI